jgi:hypothetical protein
MDAEEEVDEPDEEDREPWESRFLSESRSFSRRSLLD